MAATEYCVHCLSEPSRWGMICCDKYWNDPRTIPEAEAKRERERRKYDPQQRDARDG